MKIQTKFFKLALYLVLNTLYFTSFAQGYPETDIYLADISVNKGKYEVKNLENITNRPGYDNQPSFFDNNTIYFTSIREKNQSDIYSYNIQSKETKKIIDTPESEFSPTLMPSGKSFSSVLIEKDSTQRLWKFSLNGKEPEVIFSEIDSIGYHTWINDKDLALFILTNPFSLQITSIGKNSARIAAKNIGRCLQTVPGKQIVSFVDKTDSLNWKIKLYDPKFDSMSEITTTLKGSEDYAWTQSGDLILGNKGKLYKFTPKKDKDWIEIADFSFEITEIQRISISADGKKISFVSKK